MGGSFSSPRPARAAGPATPSTCAASTVRRPCGWERAMRPGDLSGRQARARARRPGTVARHRHLSDRRRRGEEDSRFGTHHPRYALAARWKGFLAVAREPGSSGAELSFRRRGRNASSGDSRRLSRNGHLARREAALRVRPEQRHLRHLPRGQRRRAYCGPGVDENDGLPGWAPDGRLYAPEGQLHAHSGADRSPRPRDRKQEPWREFVPADATGINSLQGFHLLPQRRLRV